MQHDLNQLFCVLELIFTVALTSFNPDLVLAAIAALAEIFSVLQKSLLKSSCQLKIMLAVDTGLVT